MAKDGRIEGRVNGGAYELVQGDSVIASYPLEDAKVDTKLQAAIKRNSWQRI